MTFRSFVVEIGIERGPRFDFGLGLVLGFAHVSRARRKRNMKCQVEPDYKGRFIWGLKIEGKI